MTKNNEILCQVELKLLASKWRINDSILEEGVYEKFRSLQIAAYFLEKRLKAQQVNVLGIEYLYEKESTFLEVVIDEESSAIFYEKARCLWRGTYEELPLHRNDKWDSKRNKPVVSDVYRDHATGSLILMIKFNTNSKRYHFPTAVQLEFNDRRENRCFTTRH